MAIELYKTGGTEQIGVLLSSTDIRELSERVAFAQRFSDAQEEILVTATRLGEALEADKSVLEEKLADALQARNDQVVQAQHLRELRSAQTSKLESLRRRVESQREEADAIAARSATIERQLAASADSPSHTHPEPEAPALGITLKGTETSDRRHSQRVRRIVPPSPGRFRPCFSRSCTCSCAALSNLSLAPTN